MLKKYHVSKNLWNNNFTVGYHLSQFSGLPTEFTTDNSRMATLTPIDVATAESVTFNFTILKPGSFRVVYSTFTTNDTLIERVANKEAPFTIDTSNASKLYIAIYRGSGSDDISESMITNIMLNTGSQPLPYEPYSSEVWHDVPYYLHNTSTDTITTLPAVLYPTGSTATVGLKGQTVQSGTPTPQNPVMPNGTGEKTGNLFDKTTIVTGNILSDGTIGTNQSIRTSDYIPVIPNTNYAASYLTIGYRGRAVAFYQSDKTFISALSNVVESDDDTAPFTFTTPNNCYFMRIATYISVNDHVNEIMCNTGSTAFPYEPYGVKIPISSANTTTPVYLGEVQTTRKIKKLVLTGNETGWTKNDSIAQSNAYYRSISGYYRYNGLCSHYATVDDVRAETGVFFGGNINFLTTLSDEIDTVDKWKTYLQQQYAAGTPVTVWYVLATETTGIVNEPLMKIGDYADELSNISIPVTAGGDTISVGTTVQPSEITANYKGWHPKTPKESNNGSWT